MTNPPIPISEEGLKEWEAKANQYKAIFEKHFEGLALYEESEYILSTQVLTLIEEVRRLREQGCKMAHVSSVDEEQLAAKEAEIRNLKFTLDQINPASIQDRLNEYYGLKEKLAASQAEVERLNEILELNARDLPHTTRCLDSSHGECICGRDG